jgi:hypothetical protein
VYELVYDGAGEDGRPFVPGLIDAEALDASTTTEVAGVKSELAGAKRADRGPVAPGSRGGENAPTAGSESASGDPAAKRTKTQFLGEDEETRVVAVGAAARAA